MGVRPVCLFCAVSQSRVDQSKVSLEALERQLEEEKQKVKNKEALSGVATGKTGFSVDAIKHAAEES